jgi:hypothetical protein
MNTDEKAIGFSEKKVIIPMKILPTKSEEQEGRDSTNIKFILNLFRLFAFLTFGFWWAF